MFWCLLKETNFNQCSDNSADNPGANAKSKAMFECGESVEFSGKAVSNLARDAQVMDKTGRVLFTFDLAHEYKFTEDDGSIPKSSYSVKNVLYATKHDWLAAVVPEFIQ